MARTMINKIYIYILNKHNRPTRYVIKTEYYKETEAKYDDPDSGLEKVKPGVYILKTDKEKWKDYKGENLW